MTHAQKFPRERAIVCLSGGMDSTVCAAMAARTFELGALHVSYGQRTEARELEAARAVAAALGIARFLHLEMDLFRLIGGSALTDPSIAVPQSEAGGEISSGTEISGPAIPITYVPFRNAHFLSAAVSWAEVLGARTIFIGAVEQDSSGYPDCRPEYYRAFQQLIDLGTRDRDITVETPLIHLRKSAIVKLGVEAGAPLDVTWSCYQGHHEACGVCDSCVLRLRAFAEAGVKDGLPYATAASSV